MNPANSDRIFQALNKFRIEIPSWGFANTGTRFGKFIQPAAATTTEEKFSDAGQVHALTGACPTVALHVLWDFPNGIQSVPEIHSFAERYGVKPGSINPNLFQDQEYKYGSFGNPDPAIRAQALQHTRDSIAIARGAEEPRHLSVVRRRLELSRHRQHPPAKALVRGTPGSRSRRSLRRPAPARRIQAFRARLLPHRYRRLGHGATTRAPAGPQAKVLVDTGHHYAAQNIEQIVAWLLSEDMLGGFHFNDRRYADDDLTLGSIDPYQVFRIFHEIFFYEWETRSKADIAYMIDQSHNLKGKIEAMIQTVCMAQELFAKACLVDHAELADAQKRCDLVKAESFLQDAFATDVRPIIQEWRRSKAVPIHPIEAFRQSGYLERITQQRSARNSQSVSSYA